MFLARLRLPAVSRLCRHRSADLGLSYDVGWDLRLPSKRLSLLNSYCNTFRLPANRLLSCARPLHSAYTLFPTAVGLARHISTMSGGDLAQHEVQSTIHANEKLVGQSGRHYLIERVLQSKEDPPAHVYLAS